jgi:hypothetical protein
MIEQKKFITEYSLGSETYSCSLYASCEDEALRLCIERGLGEKIIGTSNVNVSISAKELHLITFMSFIALKSGKMTPDEILSDRGILHEAVHIMDGSFDESTMIEFKNKLNHLVRVTHSASLVATSTGVFNGIVL